MSYPDWLPDPPEGMWWQIEQVEGEDFLYLLRKEKRTTRLTGRQKNAVAIGDYYRLKPHWDRGDLLNAAEFLLWEHRKETERQAIREEVNNARPA